MACDYCMYCVPNIITVDRQKVLYRPVKYCIICALIWHWIVPSLKYCATCMDLWFNYYTLINCTSFMDEIITRKNLVKMHSMILLPGQNHAIRLLQWQTSRFSRYYWIIAQPYSVTIISFTSFSAVPTLLCNITVLSNTIKPISSSKVSYKVIHSILQSVYFSRLKPWFTPHTVFSGV